MSSKKNKIYIVGFCRFLFRGVYKLVGYQFSTLYILAVAYSLQACELWIPAHPPHVLHSLFETISSLFTYVRTHGSMF